MPDVAYPGSSDRLPWLPNEFTRPKGKRPTARARQFGGWAVAGFLLVAGASYWLGIRSGESANQSAIAPAASVPSRATVGQPKMSSNKPQVQYVPAPAAQAARPEVSTPRPEIVKVIREYVRLPSEPNRDQAAPAQSQQPPVAAAPQAVPRVAAAVPAPQAPRLSLWPSRQVAGAGGRLVQIGAFATRLRAKLGWRHMQRAYPAVGKLPAVVVATRNSNGRKFYRFQIGTTSQAHSEVLCQRMQMIHFSCAVIGLPWKGKVER